MAGGGVNVKTKWACPEKKNPNAFYICSSYLNNTCKSEEKCGLIHTPGQFKSTTYIWLYRELDCGGSLYPVTFQQNEQIEKVFMDPKERNYVENQGAALLNFDDLSQGWLDGGMVEVKRLSTQPHVTTSTKLKKYGTCWLWYWMDENKIWHYFEKHYFIEMQYQIYLSSKSYQNENKIYVTVNGNSSILSFKRMVVRQHRKEKNKDYQVRRRPMATRKKKLWKNKNEDDDVSKKRSEQEIEKRKKTILKYRGNERAEELSNHFRTQQKVNEAVVDYHDGYVGMKSNQPANSNGLYDTLNRNDTRGDNSRTIERQDGRADRKDSRECSSPREQQDDLNRESSRDNSPYSAQQEQLGQLHKEEPYDNLQFNTVQRERPPQERLLRHGIQRTDGLQGKHIHDSQLSLNSEQLEGQDCDYDYEYTDAYDHNYTKMEREFAALRQQTEKGSRRKSTTDAPTTRIIHETNISMNKLHRTRSNQTIQEEHPTQPEIETAWDSPATSQLNQTQSHTITRTQSNPVLCQEEHLKLRQPQILKRTQSAGLAPKKPLPKLPQSTAAIKNLPNFKTALQKSIKKSATSLTTEPIANQRKTVKRSQSNPVPRPRPRQRKQSLDTKVEEETDCYVTMNQSMQNINIQQPQAPKRSISPVPMPRKPIRRPRTYQPDSSIEEEGKSSVATSLKGDKDDDDSAFTTTSPQASEYGQFSGGQRYASLQPNQRKRTEQRYSCSTIGQDKNDEDEDDYCERMDFASTFQTINENTSGLSRRRYNSINISVQYPDKWGEKKDRSYLAETNRDEMDSRAIPKVSDLQNIKLIMDNVNFPLYSNMIRKQNEFIRRKEKTKQSVYLNKKFLWHPVQYSHIDDICDGNLKAKENGDYGTGFYLYEQLGGGGGCVNGSDVEMVNDVKIKCYLLCEVVVGCQVKGKRGISESPFKETGRGDTCVDDVDDPNVHVVFDVDQIFPRYVVALEQSP